MSVILLFNYTCADVMYFVAPLKAKNPKTTAPLWLDKNVGGQNENVEKKTTTSIISDPE